MGDPGTVPPDVLQSFALDGATLSALDGGLMSQHWLAERDGARTVVRRYTRGRTVDGIAWEQELTRHAGSRGWPVAEPARTAQGGTLVEADGAAWTAAPFLEGSVQEPASPAAYRIRGRLLARLHADLANFDVAQQRPDAGKLWELDAWTVPTGAGSFNEALGALSRVDAELAGQVRRYRYRSLRELARLHYPDLPDLPVHGDFQGANLLWIDGRLSGLLDFDFARRDALVTDLATLLIPVEPLEPAFAGALVAGYESVRPLGDDEWELFPALARAAVLWWIAVQLARWRTTGSEDALRRIRRSASERLPAVDLAEPGWRSLRRVSA